MSGIPTNLIQLRVDQKAIDEASAVLGESGRAVPDVVRLLHTHAARERALLFFPIAPSYANISVIKDAHVGNKSRVEDIDRLFGELHAEN